MMRIEKKILARNFEKILTGKKNYEIRLGDFECNEGDIFVLHEIDDITKQPTGRIIEKKVRNVGKTKGIDYWPQEEIEKYGFQIILFT